MANRNPKMTAVLLKSVKRLRTRDHDKVEAFYVLTLRVNIEVG
jgi:hypothetical protein